MVMNHYVDPGNQIQVNYEQSILPLVCFVKQFYLMVDFREQS